MCGKEKKIVLQHYNSFLSLYFMESHYSASLNGFADEMLDLFFQLPKLM